MAGRGSLLRRHEVPPVVAERFILTGYRPPGCSLSQCLRSAFRATNETGNFWTHFLALFVFAARFLAPGGAPRPALQASHYPLWSYFLGVCGLLLSSCLAHLLGSRSTLLREILFCADYGAISAYTVGSALAYRHYVRLPGDPEEGPASAWLPGPRLEALYVPAAFLVALFCTWACCSTRLRRPRHRYLLRTLVFLLPFAVVSAPVFRKLWLAGGRGGEGGHFFLRHCLWLLAAGLFNVSKVPERLSPGSFDIWGHSHQWFHCCTFLSILDELHMLQAEMRETPEGPPPPPGAPTFLSTFGVMLLLLPLLAAIVAWFGARAHASQQQGKPWGKWA